MALPLARYLSRADMVTNFSCVVLSCSCADCGRVVDVAAKMNRFRCLMSVTSSRAVPYIGGIACYMRRLPVARTRAGLFDPRRSVVIG